MEQEYVDRNRGLATKCLGAWSMPDTRQGDWQVGVHIATLLRVLNGFVSE